MNVSDWVRKAFEDRGQDKEMVYSGYDSCDEELGNVNYETYRRTVRKVYNELYGTPKQTGNVDYNVYDNVITGGGRVLVISDLHCIPMDTSEVLTRNGWKKLEYVEIGETILCSNEQGDLTFSEVTNKIVKSIPEKVFKFTRKNIEIESTLKHRNLINHSYNKRYIRKTGDLIGKPINLVSNGIYTSGTNSEDIGKLIGFCLGDGTKTSDDMWKINVKKSRKIKYLDNILTPTLMTKCPQKNGYTVFRVKQPYNHIINTYLNKDKTLNIPEILKLDYTTLCDILDGIIHSDGSIKKDRPNISVASICKQSLSDIQTLCHIIGYNVTFGRIGDNRNSTFTSDKPLYNICLTKRKYNTYSGKYTNDSRTTTVGCVEVKTGLFLLKQKDSICITGNCPFHHKEALSFCSKLYREYQCDTVVFLGDIVDLHAISYHEKDPDGYSAGHELNRAIEELQAWYKEFPNAFICLGNHDVRISRIGKTSGLPKRAFKSLGEILCAPNGWKFNDEWFIDGVKYFHGTGSTGKNAHYNRAIANMQSTVQGHVHTTLGVEYIASHEKLIFGASFGCLIDIKSYAMEYGKSFIKRPVIGAGVVFDGIYAIAVPMIL